VLKDDLLFGLSSAKKFFCMDAKTGKVLWTDESPRGEAGGILNAGSLIIAVTGPAAVKGKLSENVAGDSELVAFEPNGAAYKQVARYKLSPGSGLAYPIVTGNRVYVKGNSDLTLWTID
jgi:outer membrane protein assembly factor BamB